MNEVVKWDFANEVKPCLLLVMCNNYVFFFSLPSTSTSQSVEKCCSLAEASRVQDSTDGGWSVGQTMSLLTRRRWKTGRRLRQICSYYMITISIIHGHTQSSHSTTGNSGGKKITTRQTVWLLQPDCKSNRCFSLPDAADSLGVSCKTS